MIVTRKSCQNFFNLRFCSFGSTAINVTPLEPRYKSATYKPNLVKIRPVEAEKNSIRVQIQASQNPLPCLCCLHCCCIDPYNVKPQSVHSLKYTWSVIEHSMIVLYLIKAYALQSTEMSYLNSVFIL